MILRRISLSFLSLMALGTLLLCSCSEELSNKQGIAGEVCFADNDCQNSLLCVENTCTSSAPEDDVPEQIGNDDFNCAAACAHINEDCGIENPPPENCVEDCENSMRNFDSAAQVAILECIQAASCDFLETGIDSCIP